MTSHKAEAFWLTVVDCLVEFFSMERKTAASKVSSFVAAMVKDGNFHPTRDLIYHDKPINIASDLAGYRVERTAEFAERYEAIEQHNIAAARRRFAEKKLASSLELISLIEAA